MRPQEGRALSVALPESTSTQRVSYLAPVFDTDEREFRGFGETRITEGARDPAEGAVRQRRTQFSQTDYNPGTPTFEELLDSNLNSTLRQVRTTFEFQPLGVYVSPTGPEVRGWTRPTLRETRTFHPDNTTGFLTTTAYRYFPGDDARNRLGLLREKAENANRVERFDYEIQNDDRLYLVRRKLVSVEDAAGDSVSLTELLYDDQCTHSAGLSRGLVCEKRVARGRGAPPRVTTYTYDDLGRMTREENLDGESLEYKYADDTAFKTEEKNSLGHIRSFFEHHWLTGAPGRTCGPEYFSPWGFFPDEPRCHITTRDTYGRPLDEQPAFLTPHGYVNATIHHTHHDDFSTEKGRPRHLILSETPDPYDTHQGRLPPRHRWVYLDGAGHVVLEASPLYTRVVMPSGSLSPPTWWSKRYFRYDELGRLVTAYLPIAQPDAEYGPQPSADAPAYQYRYDALDRVVEILAPRTPDDGDAIPPTEGFPRLGEANNGEAISSLLVQYREPNVTVRDASGITQTIAHNTYGEVTAVSKTVGGATLTTSFMYDVAGRRIEAQDPYGVEYSYKYYFDGSLYSAESPSFSRSYRYTDGGHLQYEYRRLASGSTDGVITFQYDAAGRIKERAVSANVTSACLDPRTFTTKFTYDAPADPDQPGANLGRLTKIEGPGHSYEFGYDALGVRAKETLVEESTQARLSVNTLRGAHGELARVEFDDLSLDYSYDEAGRLGAVTSAGTDFIDASYVYQLDGHLRQGTARIGPSTSPERSLAFQRALSYDPRGRPISSRYQISSIDMAPVADQRTMGFQYFPNDQLRAMTDSEASSSRHEWTYDNALRLSTAVGYGVLAGGQATDVLTYAYNANSTIQSVTRGSRVETYNYDSQVHSLKSIVVTGSGSTRRTTFEQDGDGNRCSELEIVNTSIPQLARGSAYTWSADGRLTRVDSFARRTSQVTDYDYDHEGTRWRETTDGASVLYLGDKLEFSANTGESKMHLSLPGGLSCSIVGHSGWTCHVKDIGNVRSVATSTETSPEISVVDYLPYGQRRGTGPDTLRFGYSGKQEDAYTGLLDYGARYYDPRSRQFLSADPIRAEGSADAIELPETLNPFAYAALNPIGMTDPDGRDVQVLDTLSPFAMYGYGDVAKEAKKAGQAFGVIRYADKAEILDVFSRAGPGDIVLYNGHGNSSGEISGDRLYFGNEPIPVRDVQGAMKLKTGYPVGVAILNSCESESLLQPMIDGGARLAFGYATKVEAAQSLTASQELLKSLLKGRTIRQAIEDANKSGLGRMQIQHRAAPGIDIDKNLEDNGLVPKTPTGLVK